MAFRKIHPNELVGNPFEMMEKQAALFTAGPMGNFNTMTIGWGCLGNVWNLPAFVAYVRPSRYSYEFAENNEYFTISYFGTPRPAALAVLGTKSGRDMDKMNQSGLTPVELDGQVAFAEATVVFICKKLYFDDMNPERVPAPQREKFYPQGDFHRVYTGEITGVYIRED